jgi:ribosomal protein S18 acetylase RimI-like enzyme
VANAKIQIVGPDEFPLICRLYNAIFRPPEDVAFFKNRVRNRETLVIVADLEGQPVGFSCGYELRPSTYYSWLFGVLPDARRLGIGSQLLAAEHAWAQQRGYEMARVECYNQQRAMILLAIHFGYDVVGIRYDSRTSNNLIIFEKHLTEVSE